MLDLRFHWDDSSPTLLVCSGGLKYILLEASVVHHLPVLSSEEMMAIPEAIHCFTSTGKMWNAKMWEEKLQRSLSIFHENFPPTTSPDAPPHPHQDPELMFPSLTQPDVVDGAFNHLSSTTVIHNLMDNDATTEDEQPQVDNIEKKEENRRKEKKSPNIEDLSPSEIVELDKKLIIYHRLPKAKQRTNVVVDGYVPQGRLLGTYYHSGRGNRASDLPISSDCKSDSSIGQNQAWGRCWWSIFIGTIEFCGFPPHPTRISGTMARPGW